MSTDSFLLRVITPSGLQVEEQVQWTTLPSSEGQIGVFPGHVIYTTALGSGILEYAPILKDLRHRLVVSGGFVNFAEGTLNVLADTSDTRESIDKGTLHTRKEEIAASMISMNGYESEWEHSNLECARLNACEQLLEK